jgi:anti-sigma-K factor RskA
MRPARSVRPEVERTIREVKFLPLAKYQTETERSHEMQREEMIILAGKYALGLLSKQEAAEAEARMETDPAFRTIVAQWQDRLADLSDLTSTIEPSSELWQRIVERLKSLPDDDATR